MENAGAFPRPSVPRYVSEIKLLSDKSVEVIQQRLKLLYDDHVSELLGILNRNIDSIKPDQRASISDSIKNFNDDTRVSLLKHGDALTSELTSTLEKLEITTLAESEKNNLVEVVESYLNPNLYLKRFNIFLQSITRHMQRRGLAINLKDYRVDMAQSICEASARNLCRTILQKITIELDILLEKGARAESSEKEQSNIEANKALELKPNLFGIGINFNYLIKKIFGKT